VFFHISSFDIDKNTVLQHIQSELMKNQKVPPLWLEKVLLITALWCLVIFGRAAAAGPIPDLDELAGDWNPVSDLRSLPAMASTSGGAKCTDNILGVDDIGFPPLFDVLPRGTVRFDGSEIKAQDIRWFPYQVLRRASTDRYNFESSVSLSSHQNAVLFRLKITNNGSSPAGVPLQIDLASFPYLLHEKSWEVYGIDSSGNPRNNKPGGFTAQVKSNVLVIHNADGTVTGAFAFSDAPDSLTASGPDEKNPVSGQATWTLNLFPNETKTISFVYACGTDETSTVALGQNLASQFDAATAQAKSDWQALWAAIFQPGNKVFPGNVPTLATDDAAVRRVYYMSLVSLLSVYRDKLPMQSRVFVSNAPEHNCTMVYFWDTREWATLYALLDPEMLKKTIIDWLTRGLHNGYSEDYLSGKLQGPWYSANDFSVFLQAQTYISVTGDFGFLKEMAGPKTVLDQLNDVATSWKSLRKPGRQLADYGGADNLLECVPTYINEVPSFNAANVWMMREAATLDEMEGKSDLAKQLRADAAALLPSVLALYEPGKGVWNSIHDDGSRVEMRHVFDFVTVGQTITSDLEPQVKDQMENFVRTELLTKGWMRAQSLQDVAAASSDRPDHGPMGAFSAWPAETTGTFCVLGDYADAIDLLHRVATVTTEGPFSQSRELMGKNFDSPVRIASRGDQTYYVSSGGSFADVIVSNLFGYNPDFTTTDFISSFSDTTDRGFVGELSNLRFRGDLYRLTLDSGGRHAARQAKN
jgi:hypothetical protein